MGYQLMGYQQSGELFRCVMSDACIIQSNPPSMQEAQLFPRYMGHQLRTNLAATVVGRLTEVNAKRNSLILQTDSESKLNIEAVLGDEQPQGFKVGKYYEVRGTCRSGKELEVRGFTCYGTDFDLVSYNQMLQLATKEFKSIFYP